MGGLFTYEQIKNGEVPTPEEFTVAKDDFLEAAQTEIERGTVTGAFVFGSAAVKLAKRRSDLDGFAALNDEEGSYHIAAKLRRSVDKKIPLVPITQTIGDLKNGHHEMDRYFGEHLKSKDRAIVGEDPSSLILFKNSPADEIIGLYLAQKKRKFINITATIDDPLDHSLESMQRILELPEAVGRKALQALAEKGHIEQAVEQTANKKEVMRSFSPHIAKMGLTEETKNLKELDSMYNTMLDRALADDISKDEYDSGLQVIRAYAPQAAEWVRKIEGWILPKLRA